jgi:hypothetical protein
MHQRSPATAALAFSGIGNGRRQACCNPRCGRLKLWAVSGGRVTLTGPMNAHPGDLLWKRPGAGARTRP